MERRNKERRNLCSVMSHVHLRCGNNGNRCKPKGGRGASEQERIAKKLWKVSVWFVSGHIEEREASRRTTGAPTNPLVLRRAPLWATGLLDEHRFWRSWGRFKRERRHRTTKSSGRTHLNFPDGSAGDANRSGAFLSPVRAAIAERRLPLTWQRGLGKPRSFLDSRRSGGRATSSRRRRSTFCGRGRRCGFPCGWRFVGGRSRACPTGRTVRRGR